MLETVFSKDAGVSKLVTKQTAAQLTRFFLGFFFVNYY